MLCRLLCFTILLNSACIEFNTCSPTSGPIIGELATTFDVQRSTVRHQSSAVGNWITDGMFWRAKVACEVDSRRPCPDLALINAGAIRDETACGSRKYLVKGPIYQADIEELLPFNSDLVVVELSGRDIQFALEHAVKGNNTSHFLQVSGISFRHEAGKIYDLQLTSRKANEAIEADKKYHVVTSNYLAQGNDGFSAFLIRDSQNQVLMNSKGRPMMKLNPETGTLLNNENKAISYRDALLEWIAEQTRNHHLIAADSEPRISH